MTKARETVGVLRNRAPFTQIGGALSSIGQNRRGDDSASGPKTLRAQTLRARPWGPVPPMQPIGPGDLTAPGLPIPPTQVISPATDPVEERNAHDWGFVRDPLSMILVLVIVVSLVVAGLLGGELYARHRADAVVASAVECIVQDKTDVSFGMRPLLYQLVTSEFSSISVETAGNQIRAAKGMKLDLHMEDIRLHKTADPREPWAHWTR